MDAGDPRYDCDCERCGVDGTGTALEGPAWCLWEALRTTEAVPAEDMLAVTGHRGQRLLKMKCEVRRVACAGSQREVGVSAAALATVGWMKRRHAGHKIVA